ncbi:MAG: protein phosphatase 2C domain-containing protein [Actinomycetota bacterium]|nr:protein phosphatase 2C domain-containing protein [Actinomycetota bacterium]
MYTSLRFAVQSEIGLRSNNEDAAYAGPRLLALADGMGGHAAGEVAASLAIKELLPLDEGRPSRDMLGDLRRAFRRANAAIADRAASDPETSGMGTTLTALLFAGRRVALAHIGDSRAYLLRNGSLHQVTRDDTLVQSLVDEGRVRPEEAASHPQRNMVLKVLTGQETEPFFEVRETDPGDRYLICSDGLSDYVTSEEIVAILEMPDPQRRPQELIRLALRHGSQDNITCVVGDVVRGPSGYNIAMLTGAPGSTASVLST